MYQDSTLNKLFDVACELVIEGGGDGDILIVVKYHYGEVVQKFDEWRQKDQHFARYIREDFEDYTLFSDQSNENILISKRRLEGSYDSVFEI